MRRLKMVRSWMRGVMLAVLWLAGVSAVGESPRRGLGELLRAYREQMTHLPGRVPQKGVGRTLADGCGNDWELSRAFQSLLAEEGIVSELVSGEVSLDSRQVAQWLPTLDASRHLGMTRREDGRWQVPMTWLRCQVDHFPQLDGGRPGEGGEWLDVFPGLVGADELAGEWLAVDSGVLGRLLRSWREAGGAQEVLRQACLGVHGACQSLLERQAEYGVSPEVLRGQGAVLGYRSGEVVGRRPVEVVSWRPAVSGEERVCELSVTVCQRGRELVRGVWDTTSWTSGRLELVWRDEEGRRWPTGELGGELPVYGRRLFPVLRTDAGEVCGAESGYAGQAVSVSFSLRVSGVESGTAEDERRIGDVTCYVLSHGGYVAQEAAWGGRGSLVAFCARLGEELRQRLDVVERLVSLSYGESLDEGLRLSVVSVCPEGDSLGDGLLSVDGYGLEAGELTVRGGGRELGLSVALAGAAVTSELVAGVCGGEVESLLGRHREAVRGGWDWSESSAGGGVRCVRGGMELSWRGGEAGGVYELLWLDGRGLQRRGSRVWLRNGTLSWCQPAGLRGNDCLSVSSVLTGLRAGGLWTSSPLAGELSALSAWAALEERALARPRVRELCAEQRFAGAGDEPRMWFSLAADGAETWSLQVVDARGQVVFEEHGSGGQVSFDREGTDESGRRCPDGTYEVRVTFAGAGGQVSERTVLLWDTSAPEVRMLAYVGEEASGRRLVVEYALEDLQAVSGELRVLSADGGEALASVPLSSAAGVERLSVPAGAGAVCLVEVSALDAYGQLGGARSTVVLGTVFAGGQVWRPEGASEPESASLGLAIASPVAGERVEVGLLSVVGSAAFPGGCLAGGGYQLRLHGGDGRLLECVAEERDGRWCLSYSEPTAGSRREDIEMAYPLRQAAVASGELGCLDLSGLANGVYTLELVGMSGLAVDACSLDFMLDSELKSGLVEFTESDGTVRVGGLSLAVGRSYSSARRADGDCGVGWRQTFDAFDLELLDERMEAEGIDGERVSLRCGGARDVTLTLPDGKRVTFAFELRPAGNWGYSYAAVWTPPASCRWTLKALGNSQVTALPGLDPYWQATNPGTPLDMYDFPGYLLTGPDGSEYTFERERLGDYDATQEDGGSVSLTCYGIPRLTQVAFADGRGLILDGTQLLVAEGTGEPVPCLHLERDEHGRIIRLEGGDDETLTLAFAYDRLGNLVSCSRSIQGEPLALRRRYRYDDPRFPHLLTAIENGAGRQLASFSFNAQGRLMAAGDGEAQSISDHDVFAKVLIETDDYGNETLYRHDDRGQVTEIVYPDGGVVSLGYDQDGRETRRTDELGFVTTRDYDGEGRLTRQTNAAGGVTRFEYDGQGRLALLTSPAGTQLRRQQSADGRHVELASSRGARMVCDSDEEGRPTRLQVSWLPQTLTASYNDHEGTAIYDDATGNLLSASVRREGQRQTQRLQWLDEHDQTLLEHEMVAESDGQGRTQRVSDSAGNWEEWRRDEEDRLMEHRRSDGSWRRFGYDAHGRQVVVWDSAGLVTCQLHDRGGRLTLSVGPESFELGPSGMPAGELRFSCGQEHGYDACGRETSRRTLADVTLTLRREADGVWDLSVAETGQTLAESVTEYDLRGQAVRSVDLAGVETRMGYDGDGQLIWREDADGNRTHIEYDVAGRKVAETNPLGQKASWSYDAGGRLAEVVAPDGRSVRYDYADGQSSVTGVSRSGCEAVVLERSEQGLLLGAAQGELRMGYDYDLASRLTAYWDGRGQRWTLERDVLGRIVSTRSPEGRQATWRYEGVAQGFSQFTDGKGNRVEMDYGTGENPTTRKRVYVDGQLAYTVEVAGADDRRLLDADGAELWDERWERDERHRRIRRWVNGRQESAYAYDDAGRLVACETPGTAFTLGYSHLGRLESCRYTRSGGRELSAPLEVRLEYDGAGRVIAEQVSDGWRRQLAYDDGGRVRQIRVLSRGVVQLTGDYQFDEAGRRVGLQETQVVSGQEVTRTLVWEYDRLGRLVAERSRSEVPGDIDYDWTARYDELDNLVSETTRTQEDVLTIQYEYDRDNCLLASRHVSQRRGAWDIAYDWDANGCLERETASGAERWTRRYQWSPERRLTRMTLEQELPEPRGERVDFLYDAYGSLRGHRRVSTAPGQPDRIREHRLCPERHVFRKLPRLLDYEVAEADGGFSWRSILLGATTPLALDDGVQRGMLLYHPHGELRRQGETLRQQTAWWSPRRGQETGPGSQGEWHEAGSGLVYLRNRFYAPRLRRFLSPDPVDGIPQQPRTFHKYAYCHNDPVNYCDPMGTMEIGTLGGALESIGLALRNAYTVLTTSKTLLSTTSMLNMMSMTYSLTKAMTAKKEKLNATLIVHGIGPHIGDGWADDMIKLLKKGNTSNNQDYYTFTWGGFMGLPMNPGNLFQATSRLLDCLPIPNTVIHCQTLLGLWMTYLTIREKGYLNMNVIAHSWGTVLASNISHWVPEPLSLLVTMGSPLWNGCASAYTNRWVNIYDVDDVVIYLGVVGSIGFANALFDASPDKHIVQIDVDNGEYLEAHTGYWTNLDVIRAIVSEL
ncbi:MAG: RHS repeat-associated core domain-containing protein, partial [Oligosphaeraceae bacterium]